MPDPTLAAEMQCTLIQSIEGNETLRREWNQLVLRMEFPQVFFTWEWALAAQRAFYPAVQPWVFVFRGADEILGIAAMAVGAGSFGKAFFLCASTADYCEIVSAPQDRAVVVHALLAELRRANVRDVVFANLPANSPTASALSSSQRYGYWKATEPAFTCWQIVLGSGEARQELKKTVARKQLEKRKLARMAKIGSVGLHHLRSFEAVAQALPQIINAQICRFLANGRISPLLFPERRKFIEELSTLLGPAGWLDVGELSIANKGAAWNFGFHFSRTLFWYMPTFEVAMESLSPGSCLLRLLVEESCDQDDVDLLDLGLGDEAYKGRFANGGTSTVLIRLEENLAAHLSTMARQKVRAWMRRSPRAEHAFRKGWELVSRIRERIGEQGMAAFAGSSARRMLSLLASSRQVEFFEWRGNVQLSTPECVVKPLDWTTLSKGALENSDDPETLRYLMRCAVRLQNSDASSMQGFVLESQDASALHFCWAADYGGFVVDELQHTLEAQTEPASVIFDCWTPVRSRGHNYYGIAVELLARELKNRGKATWIFSGATNQPSIRGLEKTGFVHSHAMVRRRLLLQSNVYRKG